MSTVIKNSKKIRKLLFERFNEQHMLYSDIVADAERHGVNIDKPRLSRYFKMDRYSNFVGDVRSSLSEDTILWLCDRWGIDVSFEVKKIKWDEESILKNLEEKYGGN